MTHQLTARQRLEAYKWVNNNQLLRSSIPALLRLYCKQVLSQKRVDISVVFPEYWQARPEVETSLFGLRLNRIEDIEAILDECISEVEQLIAKEEMS